MIWSTVIKSTIFCTMPKLVDSLYEPTKNFLSETATSIGNTVSELFDCDCGEEKTVIKLKATEEDMIFIADAWEANRMHPKKIRVTQAVLTQKLNTELHLDYSIRRYVNVWKRKFL